MPKPAMRVLDNPRLVDAILSNAGQLQISSHFYSMSWRAMFCATWHHRSEAVRLRRVALGGILARERLARAAHRQREGERQYVSDMLIALTRATAEQAFLLRAHVGNYSLF